MSLAVSEQRSLFGTRPELEATPWDEDRDVALTPRGVVRQGVRWVWEETDLPCDATVLDPGAGSGVFGAELRALLGDRADLVGVECAPHPWDWKRHYNTAVVDRFQAFAASGLRFNAVVGNPPFSQLCEYVELGLALLRPGGVMAYFGLLDWGQRGQDHEDVWRRHTPALQARVPGSVSMQRGVSRRTGKPLGADARSYCWWAWRKGPNPRRTMMETLPRLPGEDRRWVLPPGQEDRA